MMRWDGPWLIVRLCSTQHHLTRLLSRNWRIHFSRVAWTWLAVGVTAGRAAGKGIIAFPRGFPILMADGVQKWVPQEAWVEAASHLLTWLHPPRSFDQTNSCSQPGCQGKQPDYLSWRRSWWSDHSHMPYWVCSSISLSHPVLPYVTSEIKDIFSIGNLRFHDIFYSPGWSLLCLPAPHPFRREGQLLDELKSTEVVQRNGGLL